MIETLQVETQPGLGNPQPQLDGGHLLDRVRLVEHREVVWKQKAFRFPGLLVSRILHPGV